MAVKLFKDESDLGDNNEGKSLVELSYHLQQFMQREAFDGFQGDVQMLAILEGVDKLVYAFGFDIGEVDQGLFLVFYVFDAFAFFEGLFFY